MGTILNLSKREKAVFAAGSFLFILGAVVITGWHIGNKAIIQLHPSFVPMQYNTALGFLLLGISTVLSTIGHNRFSARIGLLVSALGIVTLIQYLFSIDLKIDQLFMAPYEVTKTSHPGRMAPNTALCFLISGLLFYFYKKNFKYEALTIQIKSAAVFILSLIAFFGYLLEVESAYGWGKLTRMALHTSIGFFIFSTAYLFFSGKTRPHHLQKHQMTTWVSMCALVLILVFQAISSYEQNVFSSQLEQKLNTLTGFVKHRVSAKVDALSRMADRYASTKKQTKSAWQMDAQNYIKHDSSYQAIERVNKHFIVKWIEPLKGNEKAQNLNLAFEKRRREALIKAKKKKLPTVTKPITLVQGDKGFLTYSPIYRPGDVFDGFILGVFKFRPFLHSVFKAIDTQDYKISIFVDGASLFSLYPADSTLTFNQEMSQRGTIDLFGTIWQLELTPSTKLAQASRKLSYSVFFFGVIIILIILKLVTQNNRRELAEIKANNSNRELSKRIQQVEKAEAITHAIVDAAADGIINISANGEILSINRFGLELFGYSRHELIGKNVNILMPPPYQDEHDDYIKNYINTKIPKIIGQSRELVGVKKDGSTFPMILSVGEARSSAGLVFTGIVKDITERKKLDLVLEYKRKELEVINRDLKKSNDELEKFAYIASHDLKAPLRGFTDLLEYLEEDLEEKYGNDTDQNIQKNLARMHTQVSRMNGLITGILEYSKVGSEKVNVHQVDLVKLLHQIQEELRLPKSVKFEVPENMPTIITDEIKIGQVFSNLISNAAKYHNDISNAVIKVGLTEKGEYFEFFVQDNGPGIDPRFHSKIFEIFQTLQSRDDIESTGVGLAIIKKLVRHFTGDVKIESSKGNGSTFFFTWPKDISKVNEALLHRKGQGFSDEKVR